MAGAEGSSSTGSSSIAAGSEAENGSGAEGATTAITGGAEIAEKSAGSDLAATGAEGAVVSALTGSVMIFADSGSGSFFSTGVADISADACGATAGFGAVAAGGGTAGRWEE